jgi:hypothetical protein
VRAEPRVRACDSLDSMTRAAQFILLVWLGLWAAFIAGHLGCFAYNFEKGYIGRDGFLSVSVLRGEFWSQSLRSFFSRRFAGRAIPSRFGPCTHARGSIVVRFQLWVRAKHVVRDVVCVGNLKT